MVSIHESKRDGTRVDQLKLLLHSSFVFFSPPNCCQKKISKGGMSYHFLVHLITKFHHEKKTYRYPIEIVEKFLR